MVRPAISVVICSSRSGIIQHTLNAVLSQKCGDFEVLVIDQSQTAETATLIKEINDERIRHFRDSRVGVTRARNIGLKLAKSRIVAFTDDDCVPAVDWTEKLLAFYAREPELVMVGGTVLPPRKLGPLEFCPQFHPADNICYPVAPMVERLACRSIGANSSFNKEILLARDCWFDISLGPGARHGHEDLDMSFRLALLGLTIGTTSEAVVEHRFGVRSKGDWLQYKRWHNIAIGVLAAKFRLLGKKEIYDEMLRWICISEAPSLNPVKGLKHLARWYYFGRGLLECRSLYDVDAEHMLLIRKGSSFEEMYGPFIEAEL